MITSETLNDPGRSRLVTLSGDLDMASAGELRECLGRLTAEGASSIIVDLRGVGFIDSTGIGALMAGHAAAQAAGGVMELVASTDAVVRVLRIVGIPDIMPVHADLPTEP